jgi:hypothetical protein
VSCGNHDPLGIWRASPGELAIPEQDESGDELGVFVDPYCTTAYEVRNTYTLLSAGLPLATADL